MIDADDPPEWARVIHTHPRIKTGDLLAGKIVRVIKPYAYKDGQRTVIVAWRSPRYVGHGGNRKQEGTVILKREMKVDNLRPLRVMELLAAQIEEIDPC